MPMRASLHRNGLGWGRRLLARSLMWHCVLTPLPIHSASGLYDADGQSHQTRA